MTDISQKKTIIGLSDLNDNIADQDHQDDIEEMSFTLPIKFILNNIFFIDMKPY